MSLPRYVVNFDEFISIFKYDLLDLIDDALKNKYPQIDFTNVEVLLEELKALLPYEKYQRLKGTMNLIINCGAINGIQKVEGRMLDVPPIIQKVSTNFQYDKDIYITGLHLNQTGWKKNDAYSLIVGKGTIIDKATIKEIGEHKYFNTYLEVDADTPISFILDNNSGNSRQTIIDLEYIEKIDPPVNDDPDFGDVGHDWDVGVKLLWEPDIDTDIDIYAYKNSSSKPVYYGNTKQDGIWLDFDCREHIIQKTRPEILTIEGVTGTVKIYINHYDGPPLTKPATVQVFKNVSGSYSIIKEFKVTLLPTDNDYLVGVCKINLSTLKVESLNDKRSKS